MLEIKKEQLGEIPYFVIEEPGFVPKADIILYHGWSSNAVKQCFRGQLIAGFGYRVIVPEIILHGIRGTCNYDSADGIADFFDVLLCSIKENEVLVQNILTQNRPKFVIGHSLGGMIALGTAMENHSIMSGFIAMNSSANWSSYEQLIQGVFPGKTDEILADKSIQKNLQKLDTYSPEHWKEKKMEAPVLLTNGMLDQIIPLKFNQQFCEQYSGMNIKHITFENAGHVVTDGMLAEVINFIEQNR